MEINTKFFEKMIINKDEIIEFKQGLPGFEGHRYFVLINTVNDYKVLQSIDDETVAFIVVNPFVYEKNYEFSLSEYALEVLAIKSEQDLNVYAIVTVSSQSSQWSMNLVAPVIINVETMNGMQLVLDQTLYTTKHIIRNEVA